MASTSVIDDSFPLSARPNKKDSVKGSLQLKIQYGELKSATTTEKNNNNNTVDDKDKNKHDNLKVSSRFATQGTLPLEHSFSLIYTYDALIL